MTDLEFYNAIRSDPTKERPFTRDGVILPTADVYAALLRAGGLGTRPDCAYVEITIDSLGMARFASTNGSCLHISGTASPEVRPYITVRREVLGAAVGIQDEQGLNTITAKDDGILLLRGSKLMPDGTATHRHLPTPYRRMMPDVTNWNLTHLNREDLNCGRVMTRVGSGGPYVRTIFLRDAHTHSKLLPHQSMTVYWAATSEPVVALALGFCAVIMPTTEVRPDA